MLLPTTCPVCGSPGPSPCAGCRAGLSEAPRLPPPPGTDSCAAVVAYEGVGRELVARLKYRNARSAVPALADAMASLAAGLAVDVVSWAPTGGARRRLRGFDQAEVLAAATARRLQVRCRPLLRRRPGPPQTGRSLAERRAGPVFHAPGRVPARVLLVDDVVTSGATAAAAARALRAAGAVEVHLLAAARTPPPARGGSAGREVRAAADLHSGMAVACPTVAGRRRRRPGRPQ